ncbi:Homeobox-DDT domain protein RLT2 [Linum perenne]
MEDSGGVGGGGGSSSSPPAVGGAEVDQMKKKSRKSDVENKSKRKLKTASQLEALEKTFSEEPYPSEAIRARISEQLGLTDRQLQMWFCHRRVKERKGLSGNRQRKDSPLPSTAPSGEEMEAASEACRKQSPASASRSNSHGTDPRPRDFSTSEVAVPRTSADRSTMERYYEPSRSVAEVRAMSLVEELLEEPLREDGPILGVEFDPLPPDAFAEPMRTTAIVVHQTALAQHFEANMYDQYDLKSIKSKCLSRNKWSGKRRSLFRHQMQQTLNTNHKYSSRSQSDC